jgi:hypothetical protein
MSNPPSLDTLLQELAERTYRSLEDQLYDPKPAVDGYDKERQREYILGLLSDLAQEAACLALGIGAKEP